jgi:hypothetical protein
MLPSGTQMGFGERLLTRLAGIEIIHRGGNNWSQCGFSGADRLKKHDYRLMSLPNPEVVT